MKSSLFKYNILLIAVLFITSCNDDFLDTKPLTEFSQVDVWNDPVLAEAFINEIYPELGQPYQYIMNASYSGESYSKKNVDNFNKCIISPDDLGGWNNDYSDPSKNWTPLYSSIRSCNIFLEQVDKVKFDNTLTDGKTLKDRLSGEAHFLRAYFYYYLTSFYGGVPIITKALTLTDDINLPRDTYANCIKFIVDECDLAAGLLPTVESGKNKGRATKGAALALKSRVLLYAASDLHNTVVFPGYANPELIGYTDANRVARWQAAKDAAKAVIDLGTFSLFKASPAPGDNVTQNIMDLFISMGNTEDIFVRYYTIQAAINQLGLYNFSNGYHGWGGNNPLGNLVDKYEMSDGTPFSWSNPTHKATPYKNRDPRFYATILYEGAKFRPRAPDMAGVDPLGVLRVGTWETWDAVNNKIVYVYGIDTRKSAFVEPGKGTFTGYNLLKFLDPAVDGQYNADDIPWRYFRYAEILLNYAEACIELGQDAEARTYINMIRKRAGMPDVTESGNLLRQRYRNERRIELAFEEQRFFDVRRWVIGSDGYGPNHGVDVVYKLNLVDHTTATVPTISDMTFFAGAWVDKAYFFPILRAEILKDPALLQNPGY
jgi:starch-binding outer membrane protein, SusD/RagB family